MNEKLKNLIKNIKLRQTRAIIIVIGLIFMLAATGVSAFYLVSKSDSTKIANDESANKNLSETDSIVAVVGAEDSSIIGNTKSNNSWSGEIISLNNLQVQPDREGTISQWYVYIGERVNVGQVIGKLSRPPQTPEMISMLSEKFQMLGEARINAEALRNYTTKRISQLQQLQANTENLNKQKIGLLSDTENLNKQKIGLLGLSELENDSALLSLIETKKKLAQEILRGSISTIYPIISYQTIVPKIGLNFNIQLKWTFGVVDSNLRNKFSSVLFEALSNLEDKNTIPEKSGLLYFDTVIKLANASIAESETLSEASLEALKKMVIEDQAKFITVIGEIKSLELEKVNTKRELELEKANTQRESVGLLTERTDRQRESIDTLAEIDAMIIELKKELTMSEGEVKAKEIAYASIRDSITAGYSIVAPNSGVVSSIMKKPGEFVGPGMPVATVTAEGNDRMVVRMLIPNNIQKPKEGEVLSIIRPGFGTDVQKVRLVGIGSSLDDGSYMADAVFTKETKWPIGASVRVLEPVSSSGVSIKYSSIFWSEGGTPTIWAISEADRIFAKKITVGRSLGTLIEVYTGLKNGDRYITDPTLDIKESMFLGDLVKTSTQKENDTAIPAKSGKDKDMQGMEM